MFSINFGEYEVTHSIYHYVFHFFNVGIDFSCRLERLAVSEIFSNLIQFLIVILCVSIA